MHFLIDGYNLLFFHLTPDENLKKNREELVLLLDKKLTSLNIKATIVFDGFTQIKQSTEYQYYDSLTVIFSPRAQTADEYIIESLSFAKTPNEIVVVTADKKLAQNVRNLGAHCKSPKSFLKEIANKQANKELSLEKEATNTAIESKENMERLINIFEKRLKESELNINL